MKQAALADLDNGNTKIKKMIILTSTPLTNIILQNLVSLCSYLALAINIIGFIFTCIVVNYVSLVFIPLSTPAVWC